MTKDNVPVHANSAAVEVPLIDLNYRYPWNDGGDERNNVTV